MSGQLEMPGTLRLNELGCLYEYKFSVLSVNI